MNTTSLDQIKDRYYGEKGTPERDQRAMTQAELADRIEKKRSFISPEFKQTMQQCRIHC